MKAKEGSIISTTVDTAQRVLVFKVSNGLDGAAHRTIGELTLDLTKVHASNIDYAAFHGFKQRIADKAALGQFDKEGRRVTPEMKLEKMQRLVDWYNSGAEDWSPDRVAGERVGNDEVMLARALSELHPQRDAGEIRSAVAGWTKAQRTAMMLRADLKPIIDRLTLESVSDIDTDALMAGF